MRNIKLYWVLLMSVMLSACIAHGAKFVPMPGAAGQAVVYVYRESGVIGHGLDLEISANRESIARLKVGTYEALHLAPGRYAFTAAAHKTASVVLSGIKDKGIHGNTLLRLEVDAGKTFYLRLEEGLGSLLIDSVSRGQAEPMLAKLGPAGQVRKKG